MRGTGPALRPSRSRLPRVGRWPGAAGLQGPSGPSERQTPVRVATAAAHLLLQVAKLTFDSMDMYPAAFSRPLWTALALATYLLSLVA